MEVTSIQTLIQLYYIIQTYGFKHLKHYYNIYKTTQNIYNMTLRESKLYLIQFINYYYQHNIYTNNIINNLSNNKIISLANKINKYNNKIINKIK